MKKQNFTLTAEQKKKIKKKELRIVKKIAKLLSKKK